MRIVNMTLEQRIRVELVLGPHKFSTLSQVNVMGEVFDKIKLTDDEKKTCSFKIGDLVNGQAPISWDETAGKEKKEISLENEEAAQFKDFLLKWPAGYDQADRRWMRPLLAEWDKPKQE